MIELNKHQILKSVMLIVMSLAFPEAWASETAESDSSPPADAASSADFAPEFQCGKGLKTRFANHHGTLGGCMNDELSSHLLIMPAKHNGALGFYTLTQNQGAKFYALKPELEVSGDDLPTYYLRQQDPVTKKDNLFDYEPVNLEDFAYRETAIVMPLTPTLLTAVGAKNVKTIEGVAADADARPAMLQCLKSAIDMVPGFLHGAIESRKDPAVYYATEDDLVQSLTAIVCNCQDVKGLESSVKHLVESSELRPYKSRLTCGLVSRAY